MANKIKKGDQVIVISGSCKGKTGNVLSVKNGKAVVSGINLKTLHIKPTQSNPGKIEKVEKPVDCSNLSCLSDGAASKVGFEINKSAESKYQKKKRIITQRKAKK